MVLIQSPVVFGIKGCFSFSKNNFHQRTFDIFKSNELKSFQDELHCLRNSLLEWVGTFLKEPAVIFIVPFDLENVAG